MLINSYDKFKVQVVWLVFLYVRVERFDLRDFSTSFGKVVWKYGNLPVNMASVWNCKFKHSGLSAGLAGGRGVIL